MNDRDALYLAALLQDIGVFVARAGLPEWESRTDPFRSREAQSTPRALSAAVLAEYAPRKAFFPRPDELPRFWDEEGGAPGTEMTGPKATLLRLLRMAEACATPASLSGAHAHEAETSRLRLQTPVSRIVLDRGGEPLRLADPRYLGIGPLSIRREALFPAGSSPFFESNPYPPAVRSFLREIDAIEDAAGLYALLEKYLYAVPLGPGSPDVSLFDHARTTAAIALCLYDEYTDGSWKGAEPQLRNSEVAEALPPPCLLVSGDVSGIQDFIFSVPSKRASKSLKGRSWFVQLAADACVRYLLDALELRDASLLYSGGGNFYLLVPASRMGRLEEARRAVVDALLDESLYLALGWASVGVADFQGGRFAECWKAAHEAVERRKGRRFQELGVRIFMPMRQMPPDDEGEDDPFADLTERLSRSTGYRIVRGSPSPDTAEGALLARLGMDLRFTREDSDTRATAFNRTDFAGRFRDFRFAVKDLPRFTPELIQRLYPGGEVPRPEIATGNLIDFNHLGGLAGERTGTDKLGVLKMDVDNLGLIFVRGIPVQLRGIARIAALSRTMKWFFEAYVNQLFQHESFTWLGAAPEAHETPFSQQLYPVFSGGDDFLLVGAWDAVFEFARRVRSEFRTFVGHHPGITLSAAFLVLDPKSSVARFAAQADDRLEDAKQASEAKDRVSVFGHVLTWAEFEEAAALKHRLEVLVRQRGESRALVQRVQQSAAGYERLRDAALRGRFRPEKIWRMAYFLARNAKKENLDEVRQIADIHERLLLDAFIDPEQARSPDLFTVAGRWAELATRNVTSAAADARRARSPR
jgi:CRISPR-associated protein Csm1